jgi:hypothetical protein
VIDQIREIIEMYSDWDGKSTFKYGEVHEEEICSIAENIIAKPYKEWMAKEKTKIRYNFG